MTTATEVSSFKALALAALQEREEQYALLKREQIREAEIALQSKLHNALHACFGEQPGGLEHFDYSEHGMPTHAYADIEGVRFWVSEDSFGKLFANGICVHCAQSGVALSPFLFSAPQQDNWVVLGRWYAARDIDPTTCHACYKTAAQS